MKILIIEDDRETAGTLRDILTPHYIVEVAYSTREGEELIHQSEFDVVLLDIALRDGNGLDLCKLIRSSNPTIFILMVTGSIDLKSKMAAFTNGADDYVTKPYAREELIARIRALLRRQSTAYTPNVLSIGDLTIDIVKRSVTRNCIPIVLRKKEFQLLEYLLHNEGIVLTRDMILGHVWESTNDSLGNVVDVHIKNLRDAIDRPFEKKLIKTVYGLGYKLEE